MAAQIEQTSKKFKAMQAVGYLFGVIGLVIVAASVWRIAGGQAAMRLGIIVAAGGLSLGFVGGGLAWWYHR